MKATQVIKNQMIEDLLVTALEGGSNYWYYLPDTNMCEGYRSKNEMWKDEKNSEKQSPFLAIRIHEAVLDGKIVPVMDYETMDFADEVPTGDMLGDISLENYERAENLLLEKHPHVLANIIKEYYDASDADVWFQLVVMGDVVYE